MTSLADPYRSRHTTTPHLKSRWDPVVYGPVQAALPEPLTTTQVSFYEANGYLFLDNLFSADEVQEFHAELTRLRHSVERQPIPEVVLEPDGSELRSIFAIHQSNPLFARLPCDRRLVHIVTYLLNSPA